MDNPHITNLSLAISAVVETDFLESVLDAQSDSGEDPRAAYMALSLTAALIRLRVHIEKQETNWLGSGYSIFDMSDVDVLKNSLAHYQAECLLGDDVDEYDD